MVNIVAPECWFTRELQGYLLIKNSPFLGPYSTTIPRVTRWSQGEGVFLMSEVPLYGARRPPDRSTEGPSWGYRRCVLGAIGALLSTFGREVPRFPEIYLKIDF